MSQVQEFDFSVDLLEGILWEYNDALNLQTILNGKQARYNINQEQFWTDWYNNVFNLQTANAFGLTVWSIILNIAIVVVVAPAAPKNSLFFGAQHENFTHGNFAPSPGPSVALNVEQARAVLRLRYFQLVSRGTIPDINRALLAVFGEFGPVYVRDNLNMTMTYVFGFQPSSALQFVLEMYDILPRPAGVSINIVVELVEPFGFDPNGLNFDNSTFGA